MSEEEGTSEGYYSDASFSSSVAVSVTGQDRAELGEEDYDLDQSYTISFHEGVVPMEVEDEEQIEDDDSDDGCIRSPVRDRWTATQSQEQVDELLGDCDQDDCQSDSEGYTSTRTKSPMEDEEETATVHCIPTSQTSAAHGLLGWLVHKKDDLLDDFFPTRSKPALPVTQTPAKDNLPYVSTPSSATNAPAVRNIKWEGPTDYDPASHSRLAKMNKRLRRKLQTKQRQLKAKDAKIAELLGQVKELDKQVSACRLSIAKLKRTEVDLARVIERRDRETMQKEVELLEMKRQISEGDLHKHQVNIFMKGLAHFCDSWLGNRNTTQTRLNIDNPIGPPTASLSEGFGKARSSLSYITLRNFVDKVQEKLAFSAGLAPDFPDPTRQGSTLWRKKLNSTAPHRSTAAERLAKAKELFQGLNTESASRALVFLSSPGAQLVTEVSSEIRRQGDAVAHGPLYERDILMAVECLGITGRQEEAIRAGVDFFFS